MDIQEKFIEKIIASYRPKGTFINLGAGILDGHVIAPAKVNLSLKMMNRHGLIAGATGTGKTRTLQLIAEQLSDAAVPVFMLDVKGDLSGLHEPGRSNASLEERGNALDIPFSPSGFPVELFSLSGNLGIPIRIRVTDLGPVLLSRILRLNDTQEGVLAVLFKYAADHGLSLVDLEDVKKLLAYLSNGKGAEQIKADYGKISSATSSTMLRKIVAIEQQGVGHIFAEPEIDIQDLFQKVDGKGIVGLLNISDVQDQPIVFSTFLLGILSQLYNQLPEVGDLEKPKLVFFFDEAHLLFKDASKAFLSRVEQIIRLIRSKGIGVFFCTQAATDIPESVLGQLGNRVQHALRAFTPNDAEALRKTARTYPRSDFYDIEKTLTSLGTGQAMITVLNDKGIPTEAVATHLVPPRAVMGPLGSEIYIDLYKTSDLYAKYANVKKSKSAADVIEEIEASEAREREVESSKKTAPGKTRARTSRESPMEAMTKSASRTLGREGVRLLTRLGTALITAFIGGKKKR